MKKTITSIATALFSLGALGLQAQTTCSADRVAYVNSKNTGTTGAYTLSVGAEEKASQAFHYSGPGKVSGARIFGDVPTSLGVKLRVSLYNVDANDRPTGPALAVAPLEDFYFWSPSYFDVSFSPAVPVSSNFAVVVEVVHVPGWGHDFALTYTGNGEGLGEDLASLAGTSTGSNWASAMTAFGKDGDFYIYPRMINFNTPMFSIPSACVSTGSSVAFTNETQMTTDPMFNTITAAGYSGSNFLYSWDFGDGSAISHAVNPTHTYAAPGAYTVTLTSVIDGWDLDCSKSYSKAISVGLAASTTAITNVSCFGGNNGSVTAVANGGFSPYIYNINGGAYQSSPVFNTLTAGTYTLLVKDFLGCTQTATATITQPAEIDFTTASSTTSSCGNSDGGIMVATAGGVPPMQYQLNAGSFQASGSFTSLSAGAYTVIAKDGNGCTNSMMVVVNDAGGPVFGVVNHTNVSCFNGNDGTISLSSLGGTGSIQYSIDGGGSYQSSGIFSGLTAGRYPVIVKDAAGCTDIQIITITQPQQLVFEASVVDVSCNGGSNGQINILYTTGGTGSVSYSVDGSVYQSGTTFPGLTAGAYTVYAKDVTGCISQINVTVGQPSPLTASVSSTNAFCNGYQDGTITVTGVGGTPGYTYGIGDDDEYQSTGSFGNLAAGTYALVVNDANGCVYNTNATITEPSAIVPTATTTNSTCGNPNGGILAAATGGSGSGYTYSINGGAFGAANFSGLAAGVYVITAKDGAGCVSSINVTVFDSNGPSILSSTHTNVNCHGGYDGSITVGSVSGGTGTLLYSVNGLIYQTSPVFTGLIAGTYVVTVKDAVGCIGSTTITITEPNAFVITPNVVNASCNGASNGSITLLVGGGAGTLAYSIDGGINYQSSNVFSGLSDGTYTVTVRDAGGCTGDVTVNIAEPVAINSTYTTLNVSCNGAGDGSLIIHAWGGTGALQYSLDGTTYQSSNIFSGLSGGLHVVYIKDANGCVNTMLAFVNEPTALTVNGTVSDVTCSGGNNGVIDLSANGGIPFYSFDWSNGVNTEDNFSLTAGTYSVIVSDANGCTSTASFVVTQPASPIVVNGTVTNFTSTVDGSIDVTVTGGAGGYTFLWSNGLTTEDVSSLNPGVYTVVVTDANGCAVSTTFIVTNVTGIASVDAVNEQINIYPNPAKDFMVIEINGYTIDKVDVYDVLGQLAYSSEYQSSKVTINTNEFRQGVYFVKILVDNKLITKKMRVIK